MRMLVLGAGLQGSACAYDLLQNNEVTEVRLADLHISHLPEFLHEYSGPRLIPTPLDVRDREAVLARDARVRRGDERHPVLLQLRSRASRGRGRRALLRPRRQHRDRVPAEGARRETRARRRSSVVPDCGLAPGMVNILAQYGIEQLDTVEVGEDLRRRTAAASRAAAQLPDRVLARGRARLLHDAVVGPARREAHAGEGALASASR